MGVSEGLEGWAVDFGLGNRCRTSLYNGFNKLQGVRNYVIWKSNMRTVLLSLRQWGMVDGLVAQPVPAVVDYAMPAEVTAMEAWDLRVPSAFPEISFRVGDSVKGVLGSSQSPKDAWDALAWNFRAGQEGIQSSLITKLQLAAWEGSGSILTHLFYAFDMDQSFHCYFTGSLPPSLCLFIAFYDDKSFDADLLL